MGVQPESEGGSYASITDTGIRRAVRIGSLLVPVVRANAGYRNSRDHNGPEWRLCSGVVVNITQTATGVRRVTQTAADGKYEVRYLVPGEYSIEVRAQGFRAARASSVVVQINQQARLDFSLQVGEVQETVEVSSTAPLLNTETATWAR